MIKNNRFSSLSAGLCGYAVVIIFVLALVLGGGSRIELIGPVLLRCMSVLALAWVFWPTFGIGEHLSRPVAWFIAALLALPLLQLIPLPWSVWTQLPGRDLAASVYHAVGTQPWQPLSLTPERTWNAFMALLPPLAAFMIARRIDDAGATRFWLVLAVAATVSGLMGILQVIGGEGSRLYLYRVTNGDSSVGFFANANHHALFMCAGIVATLRWMTLTISGKRTVPKEPVIIAAMMLAALLASIPATMSRAGFVLALLALVIGLSFIGPRTFKTDPDVFRRVRIGLFVAVAAVFAVVSLQTVFGGAENRDLAADSRLQALPQMVAIAGEMFPFGSGLGSFDAVFRSQETMATIGATYLNNAHNDALQIVIEAGLGAAVLALIFLLWWVRRGFEVWTAGEGRGAAIKHGRAASAIIGLALLHSLVDYPLRTSAMAVVLAISVALLLGVSETAKQVAGTRIPKR